MEASFTLDTRDGHKIHGIHNAPGKTEKAIVFVHGLTDHKNTHLFYNAARFFSGNGFATIRFDLYTPAEKGRALLECSFEDHLSDFATVIREFSSKYPKIFLVGHSLGGPIVLNSPQEKVCAISLWDPSIDRNSPEEMFLRWDERCAAYRAEWGATILMSKRYIGDVAAYSERDRMLKMPRAPLQVVCAGNGELKAKWESVTLRDTDEFRAISGASHHFDEGVTADEVFEAALSWFCEHS